MKTQAEYIEGIKKQLIKEFLDVNPNASENKLSKLKKSKAFKEKVKQLYNEKKKVLYNSESNLHILQLLKSIKFLDYNDYYNEIKEQIEYIFKNENLYGCNSNLINKKIFKLNLNNLETFFDLLKDSTFIFQVYISESTAPNGYPIYTSLYDKFFKNNNYIINSICNKYQLNPRLRVINDSFEIKTVRRMIGDLLPQQCLFLCENISKSFNYNYLMSLIFENKLYKKFKSSYLINAKMLKEIPEDFTLLFPQARLLNRHFTLHIGDTNTGKTYQAIQALKEAETGTYLAPLRLLALEIQERFNNEGIPCSMTTGEEEDIIEDAQHMSSTVEKLNLQQYYDTCVIDEAQMIIDEQRGWAWTNAILGVNSKNIHVCMSENARNIIIKLIELCDDTYEIVEHKRNTDLIFENKNFNFKNGIQKHDALIVFSRKKVLKTASELEKMGIKASVIYGALPYSVRKNEVRKFIDGETQVVVSTDAIGLGMNLPIKRVVFLESMKFDGKENRYLKTPEIKQIAGRAGRMGLYDVGYVNSLVDREYIRKNLYQEYTSIQYARIQLPKSLLALDMTLSEIIQNWSIIKDKGIFKKATMKNELKLCHLLEENIQLPKETMLDLINIPFDEKISVLEDMWLSLILCFYNDRSILKEINIPTIEKYESLETLELKYKQLDLLFSFCRTTHYNENNFIKNIVSLKEEVALQIMERLKK